MLETLMRLEMVYDAEVNRLKKSDPAKAIRLAKKQIRLIQKIRQVLSNEEKINCCGKKFSQN